MPLTSTYYNTPINFAMAMYYNCKIDSYFILLYLKLKNTGNIKDIKKDTFKKFKKRRFFKVSY